ncbi:MAG: enoyl-CoA hydratase/isomerase family protein [Thermaerobacter sp.]|nr:enoyl-CoA hydratase/isomerase family protein [Thermaerobacter sp.]
MADFDGSILTVTHHPEKSAAVVTLNAPPFNVVTIATREHLASLFDGFDKDPAVRVIILQSAGEHFSSGGDIPGFLAASPEYLSELHRNVAAPERCSKPVIARLTGFTFGVGLELALACDFRIASDTTLLALPEMRLGMIPGSGGTQRVARLAGLGRAKDMIMRARRIAAAEAWQWGLLTEVLSPPQLDERVWNLVDELLAFSPLAQKYAKRALNESLQGPLQSGLEFEGALYGFLRTSADFQEGVAAFKAKRAPRFQGK